MALQNPLRRQLLKLIAAAPMVAAAGPLYIQGRAAMPVSDRFALRAGWALIEDANGRTKLLPDHSVLVHDGAVEDIVAGPLGGGIHEVHMPGDMLLPGMISGHTHVCSATPTRGLIEGGRSFAQPLLDLEMLDDETLDALTAFNLAELLLSGCTTQLEMALSLRQAESYVRVAKAWGARGYPGAMVPGISRLFPIWFRRDDQVLIDAEAETLAEIDAAFAFGKRHMNTGGGLIKPMMTPHAADTQTPATMKAFAAAAKELGTGIHIHLAQGAREVEAVQRLWGMSPALFCDQYGLMDGPFFAAHMTDFDFAADGPLMRARGGVYATCPSAGGAGGPTQPWPEALAAGVPTNIGIDTHSNDYLENLKLAVLYGQARYDLLKDTHPALVQPTIDHAIDAATRIPADALRRPDLGRIKIGARADIISVDVSDYLVGTGALPPEPLNHLLYASGKSVRHTLVDGRFKVWDRRLAVADSVNIARRGGLAVRKIWDMLRDKDWF